MTETLTPAELRTLFLFEALTDEQLAWLARQGSVQRVPGRDDGLRRGRAGRVLLRAAVRHARPVPPGPAGRRRDGPHRPARRLHGRDAGLPARTTTRPQTYAATMRAISDCRFFVLPAADFGQMIREWFPMAMHLLEGLFLGDAQLAGASSASGSGSPRSAR